jgi:autoinducer 2 (AI-2) kinase
MAHLMAIDAGTGSIRAVIFDLDGNQIGVGQHEWIHLQEEGVADSMGFDIVRNWRLVKQAIEEAISNAGVDAESIVALSATSMREGIILYDEHGEAIWGVANVDARAKEEVAMLHEKYRGMEERFYRRSGQTFALGALPRLLWLQRHNPHIYEKVASISMIGDWILAKLCGVIATDPSNGGTTGIFSLKQRDWDRRMAQEVGIERDIFPKVLETGSYMGEVLPKVATEVGLSPKTKVFMGGGDVQLGAVGLGVIEEGAVAILGGSFWQQVVNIPSTTPPPEDMRIRINPHVVKGLSQAEGITFFSGLVMRWFRDAFCEVEKSEAKQRGVDPYEVLEEKASKVPIGSHGILPIFSDSMKYGKWYHASPSFINLSIDPHIANRASMFRSLEENAAIVSMINLKRIEKFIKREIKQIVFAGGASRGALWCQILADVTGCRICVPKVTEATALGCVMVAGVGAGIYHDLATAVDRLVVWDREYQPNMEAHATYKEIAKRWEEVYAHQLDLVDRGLTQSMWSAPGL